MRISDWSSDVCSSDLGGDAALYRWTEIDKAGRRDHRSPSAGTKRRYQRLKAFCYSRLLCSAGRHPRFQSTIGSYDNGHEESHRRVVPRSEEHTSELQSLMRISYAVLCWQKKNNRKR